MEVCVAMLFQSSRLLLESCDRVATLWLTGPSLVAANLDLILDLDQAISVVRQNPFLDVLVIRATDSDGFTGAIDLDLIDSLLHGEALRGFALAGQTVLT